MMNNKILRRCYQQPGARTVVTEGNGHIGKHDEITDQDRKDIRLAFAIQLILNGPLKQHKVQPPRV